MFAWNCQTNIKCLQECSLEFQKAIIKDIIEKVQAIVYDDSNNKPYFLILHRKLHWKGWEHPKGSIKKTDKSLENTVNREIKELSGAQYEEYYKKAKSFIDDVLPRVKEDKKI